MKTLSIISILFLWSTAVACPNMSGKFQGVCKEVFSGQPELNKNPEINFDIDQMACDQVTVNMTAVSSGLSTKDTFDLTVDKTEIYDTEKAKIFSIGAFENENFVGIIDYVSKHSDETVFRFKTTYKKIDKSGVSYLSVFQTSLGYSLSCEVPVVN